MFNIECCNPNIGFTKKCEAQGPMRLRACFTNGGECKGWNPMTPKCTPILGVTFVGKLWMFKALVGREKNTKFVATLALGLRPRQGLARLWAKKGSPGVKGSVREWTLTLPKELPPWELESRWTPECSKNDCRGQNPMDWKVFYTIEKLLKRRCLKWVPMTHLDI
jgi:hypothetical protein